MISKKNLFLISLFIKYLVLFSFIPNLEIERYTQFFDQCRSFSTCLNPYSEIINLDNQLLTFPYSSLMYFVLLPFFFASKIVDISFVILAYLFFEVSLLSVLQKIFQIEKNKFMFIVIFNR